jgi:hypothetical protein
MRNASLHNTRTLLVAAAVAALSGCATSRGILDYSPPESTNLGNGPAVRIASVSDARVFAVDPPDPSIPSLKNDEIKDPAITSRAIARKRNGYGKAIGDILLPEGRTVSDLVRASVARGLREGGYRVLAEGDEGYAEAAPIDVEIRKFWMWITPGFLAAHLEFKNAIALKGPIPPLTENPEVGGYVRLPSQAAGTGAWSNTLKQGLENFNVNLIALLQGNALEPASAAPEGAPPAAAPAAAQ